MGCLGRKSLKCCSLSEGNLPGFGASFQATFWRPKNDAVTQAASALCLDHYDLRVSTGYSYDLRVRTGIQMKEYCISVACSLSPSPEYKLASW